MEPQAEATVGEVDEEQEWRRQGEEDDLRRLTQRLELVEQQQQLQQQQQKIEQHLQQRRQQLMQPPRLDQDQGELQLEGSDFVKLTRDSSREHTERLLDAGAFHGPLLVTSPKSPQLLSSSFSSLRIPHVRGREEGWDHGFSGDDDILRLSTAAIASQRLRESEEENPELLTSSLSSLRIPHLRETQEGWEQGFSGDDDMWRLSTAAMASQRLRESEEESRKGGGGSHGDAHEWQNDSCLDDWGEERDSTRGHSVLSGSNPVSWHTRTLLNLYMGGEMQRWAHEGLGGEELELTKLTRAAMATESLRYCEEMSWHDGWAAWGPSSPTKLSEEQASTEELPRGWGEECGEEQGDWAESGGREGGIDVFTGAAEQTPRLVAAASFGSAYRGPTYRGQSGDAEERGILHTESPSQWGGHVLGGGGGGAGNIDKPATYSNSPHLPRLPRGWQAGGAGEGNGGRGYQDTFAAKDLHKEDCSPPHAMALLATNARSKVYVARVREGGTRITALRIVESSSQTTTQERQLRWCLSRVRQLRHENLVRVLGASYSKKGGGRGGVDGETQTLLKFVGPTLSILYELCDAGSLADLLTHLQLHGGGGGAGGRTLGTNGSLEVLIGLSSGLQCLHENSFVHGNLRPSKVLFTSNGAVKITDWGVPWREACVAIRNDEHGDVSSVQDEDVEHMRYAAPEVRLIC